MDDKELVALAQAGNEKAFAALVKLHINNWRGIIAPIIKQPDDEQEAMQIALIKLYRFLPKFKGEASFGWWSHRVVKNVCLSYVTSPAWTTRQFTVSTAANENLKPFIDEALHTTPEHVTDALEFTEFKQSVIACVEACLATFTPDTADVWRASVLHCESDAAIAERYNISEVTVRTRRAKVKKALCAARSQYLTN